MSRLDFAPKIKEIAITDIKNGLGVFTPKPDRPVSFAALKGALKKAGYTLDSAEITISGTLKRDGRGWWLVATPTNQRFALEGPTVDQVLNGAAPEMRVEITGDWKTLGAGASSREVLAPRTLRKAERSTRTTAAIGALSPAVRFERARFEPVDPP
ncbi:MAG: hypothetical protein LC672_03180, partial [Acidobacteria bacterium]|nr:hypothetical protein [Acidobacteriota bacterium]